LEIRDYMMALFKPNIPRKPLIELVLWKESGTVHKSSILHTFCDIMLVQLK